MHVLMVTSEWPTPEHPERVPFVVQQVESLHHRGIEVEIFSFRGDRNPFNYAGAWWDLRKKHNLKSYDLIHAHFGQSGLLALGTRLPLVVTFHGSDLQGIVDSDGNYSQIGYLQQLVSRLVAHYATEVIIVSEHLKAFLPRRVARFSHIIPGGVDFEIFDTMSQNKARQELGLPMERHLVLFPADPKRPVKRYRLAQQAIQWINEHGDLEVELVVLSGVSHDEVPIYMNACDALILTSKHEGSPTVVKEALACNLPVVSVDVGDVRVRIEDIEGCFVCKDDEISTIATNLRRVLFHGERIQGRESLKNLGVNAIAKRVADVYKIALSQ